MGWGSGLQEDLPNSSVPWLGIEPTTLCARVKHLIHWATAPESAANQFSEWVAMPQKCLELYSLALEVKASTMTFPGFHSSGYNVLMLRFLHFLGLMLHSDWSETGSTSLLWLPTNVTFLTITKICPKNLKNSDTHHMRDISRPNYCPLNLQWLAAGSFYNKTHREWWIISFKPTSGLSGWKNSRVTKQRVGSADQIDH